MPHDGGCGRLTERFPSRGRRASTAFARKPVVSSARPARRDAGATKTRHRRRRRFSRRDGPASRARRERERATYLDGAERRGGGKGEGGHLRGLYVNGAFVCAAHRRRRASQHAFETRTLFVSPFASFPSFRSTVERRRAIDGLILESKGGAFFAHAREKPSVSRTTAVIYSRKQQRTHNAFRLTGRIWPPSALLWARRCLGERRSACFGGAMEMASASRAVPALPLDRPRDVLRALSNRVRQPRVDANWVSRIVRGGDDRDARAEDLRASGIARFGIVARRRLSRTRADAASVPSFAADDPSRDTSDTSEGDDSMTAFVSDDGGGVDDPSPPAPRRRPFRRSPRLPRRVCSARSA